MGEARQRPGAACEECRRRKLKCDGAEPRCSVCAGFGVDCVVVGERAARGPKKGYLKALRNRVGTVFHSLSTVSRCCEINPPSNSRP